MRAKPFSRFWLFLILLTAFALRLYRLGVASLWYDETVSVILAQKDLLALARHTAGDIHPPLYYYLLHFWGRLAGWSEFSVAFLSLFCGIVLIALVYRAAHAWFNARVALIAALLVALSPYNLWYSQEARMYTLGALLGLASVCFFARMLVSRQSPVASQQSPRLTSHVSRDFIAYVIISALGLYTLYYFAFLLVFENLVALVWLFRNSQFAIRDFEFRISNYELRIWFSSQLAILALFAPWLPIAFRQATDPPVPPWRSFTPLPNVTLESFSALTFGQSVDPFTVFPILVIVAGVIAFAFWYDRRPLTGDHRTLFTPLFLLGYTFVPLFIIYALSLWKPLYHVRYIFTYSPAFYILLALGVERIANCELRIAKRILLPTAYCLLLTISVFSAHNLWFNPRYAKDDLRGAVHYLAEHWRPGDAILINAGYTYTAFLYYSDLPIAWRGRLTEYASFDSAPLRSGRITHHAAVVLQTGSLGGAANLGWGNPESDFYATTADETRAALGRVFAAHPRVWMLRLYDTVVDPDGVIRDYLAARGRIIDDEGFAGESYARVQGYLTTRAPLTALPSTATRREILLGNRIALLGFEPPATLVRAGAPLDVDLYWHAREPTNVDARLYIGLFAQDGIVVASSDEIPIGNALGTSRWTPGEILREPARLIIPKSVAPGDYVLRVALYNPRTNETLSAPKNEFVTAHGQIILSNVQVEK
ncbi:MAG: glycosyltransferase family 39 protein [Chloroflexota bacterium]